MRTLTGCFDRKVRLTDERLAHICEHPELAGMELEIEDVLRNPRFVRPSRSDDTVRLFYGFYSETLVGSKWLCVVTAYLTNKPKAGEDLWRKK